MGRHAAGGSKEQQPNNLKHSDIHLRIPDLSLRTL
jgi:hypothetical protein